MARLYILFHQMSKERSQQHILGSKRDELHLYKMVCIMHQDQCGRTVVITI